MAVYESSDDKLQKCPKVVLKYLTAEQYVDFRTFFTNTNTNEYLDEGIMPVYPAP